MNDRAATTALALLVTALGAGGCTTERVVTSDGRPMPPEPRAVKPPPPSAVADRMLLLLGPPEDTDGNGFPDLINATTALFAREHTTSLTEDGVFVFTLYEQGDARREDAAPIAEWRLPVAGLEVSRSFYGPCYPLRLSLLADGGSDMLPAMTADLRARFEPADGRGPVHASDEMRPVRVGRRTGSVVLPGRAAVPE